MRKIVVQTSSFNLEVQEQGVQLVSGKTHLKNAHIETDSEEGLFTGLMDIEGEKIHLDGIVEYKKVQRKRWILSQDFRVVVV